MPWSAFLRGESGGTTGFVRDSALTVLVRCGMWYHGTTLKGRRHSDYELFGSTGGDLVFVTGVNVT